MRKSLPPNKWRSSRTSPLTYSQNLVSVSFVNSKLEPDSAVALKTSIHGQEDHALKGFNGQLFNCTFRQLDEVLDYLEMHEFHTNPSSFLYLLRRCNEARALSKGKRVHNLISKDGLIRSRVLNNLIIDMYGKCGSIVDARLVFDSILLRNIFTWNILISAYAQNGYEQEALQAIQKMRQDGFKPDAISWNTVIAAYSQEGHVNTVLKLFNEMEDDGCVPDKFTFTSLLSSCSDQQSLPKGMFIHALIVLSDHATGVPVQNALISMYAKCGHFEVAMTIFKSVEQPGIISWTAIIATCTLNGQFNVAQQLFWNMASHGVMPNKITFISILEVCYCTRALLDGKIIHACIIKSGLDSDLVLSNALLNMYSKCSNTEHARQVFDNMQESSVISWTSIIAAHCINGHGKDALKLLRQMCCMGQIPNEVTYVSILHACDSTSSEVKLIHAFIITTNADCNVILGTAMITTYGKCKFFEVAHRIFGSIVTQDVVSWTAIISAYAQNECGNEAFRLFKEMQQEGIIPNKVTYIMVIDACASMAALEEGRKIHSLVYDTGLEMDVTMANALLDMYSKSGSLEESRRTFEEMPEYNMVSWNAIVAAYARYGQAKEAFHFFRLMQLNGEKPDAISLINILFACSHAGMLLEGHHYFVSMSLEHNIVPVMEQCGCIVDLFGRAGQFDEAEDWLDSMPFQPTSMFWSSLLGASRMHCDGDIAKHLAQRVLDLEVLNPSSYVLLAHVFCALG